MYREAKRILTRIDAYGKLPIFSLLASSGQDIERIERAFDALTPLTARARAAVAVLRRYLPKGSSPG